MKKILIIEHDLDVLDLLQCLVDDLGFDAVKLNNVKTISEIVHISPDLILLDNWLDPVNGNSLCLQIKEHPPIQKIPLILLSTSHDVRQIAEKNQADGFLKKPFEIIELNEMISSYLK